MDHERSGGGGHRRGGVTGTVVHDQDAVHQLGRDFRKDQWQGLLLIEGRDQDPDAGSGGTAARNRAGSVGSPPFAIGGRSGFPRRLKLLGYPGLSLGVCFHERVGDGVGRAAEWDAPL